MTKGDAVQKGIDLLRNEIREIKKLHAIGRLPFGMASEALRKATENLHKVTHSNRVLKS